MSAPTHNTTASNKPSAAPPAPVLKFPTMYGQKKGKVSATRRSPLRSTMTDTLPTQTTPLFASFSNAEQPVVPTAAPVSTQLENANREAANAVTPTAVQRYGDTVRISRAADKFREVANWPLDKRLAFLQGPTIDVTCGTTNFTVPRGLMTWASTTACEKNENDELTALDVNPILVAGVQRLLHWLPTSLSKHRPYGLASVDDDAKALAIDNEVVCAGEALGMHAFVHKLRGFWLQRLKSMSVEDMGFERLKILEDRISDDFDCTIALRVIRTKALAYVYEGNEPARIQLLEWLRQLPKMQARFSTVVDEIEQQHGERRTMASCAQHKRVGQAFGCSGVDGIFCVRYGEGHEI
ncbi:hypothetical protein P171DRAFT_200519 [Karstenula rhodostoma CBS 690.94]|uniref:Uncharacterized protein n=1 Tax=Karstenula rhodostoma CBS 690.94 TaxID=1392251 RepID=A0A9P4PR93_9PLEO|nr:hypothetical protein P171DRAFT_200519 [Karstenula rhodostoma CBS 690.94]